MIYKQSLKAARVYLRVGSILSLFFFFFALFNTFNRLGVQTDDRQIVLQLMGWILAKARPPGEVFTTDVIPQTCSLQPEWLSDPCLIVFLFLRWQMSD